MTTSMNDDFWQALGPGVELRSHHRFACSPHSAMIVVTSSRHHRWVEVARADQRALMRSDAVDHRSEMHVRPPLRWRRSGSGSPVRAVERADVFFNYHGPYTHAVSPGDSTATVPWLYSTTEAEPSDARLYHACFIDG